LPLEVSCLHTKDLDEEDSLTEVSYLHTKDPDEDSLTDMYLGLSVLPGQLLLGSHWEKCDQVENESLVGHKIQSVFEIDNPYGRDRIVVQVSVGENDE
jgi:hypothetical protein